METEPIHGVYGAPPPGLMDVPEGAIQFSPLVPGSADLAEFEGRLASIAMMAPPGTLERRHDLALALKALRQGGLMAAAAPRDKGGARLGGELKTFGIAVAETARAHHRICSARIEEPLAGLDAAIAAGAPRLLPSLGLWSQPGIFAWDRIDAGSALLLAHLPPLSGSGADLGCGIGVLARAVLASDRVSRLLLVDIDRRAVAAARRNVIDPRAQFLWADLRATPPPSGLDFVVMNPPFHDGGGEDRALGQAFVERAAAMLRPGGVCWLTANRHLPYEAPLARHFAAVRLVAEEGGYKIHEARR